MIVKIMSGEDIGDSNPFKCFTLVETDKVEFTRDKNGYLDVHCRVHVPTDHVVGGCFTTTNTITAEGNVYVMNNEGKTIQSVGCKISPVEKIKK